MLMLKHINPSIPYEKKLPDPYTQIYKSLHTSIPVLTTQNYFTTQAEKQQTIEQKRNTQNQKQASIHNALKQYTNIYMSDENIQYIDNIIKILQQMENNINNNNNNDNDNNHTHIDTYDISLQQDVVNHLLQIGFDSIDIENTTSNYIQTNNTITVDTCIEYLLVNVVQDRLPNTYIQQSNEQLYQVISDNQNDNTNIHLLNINKFILFNNHISIIGVIR